MGLRANASDVMISNARITGTFDEVLGLLGHMIVGRIEKYIFACVRHSPAREISGTSHLFKQRNAGFSTPKASGFMIVDQSRRLHPRVDDHRPDEREAPLLQRPR